MPTLVIGPGAVGLYVATALLRAGEAVVLWARPRSAAALQQRGLQVRFPAHTVTFGPQQVRVVTSPGEALRAGPYRAAFLTVKTYHLPALLPALQQVAPAWPVLVDLLNGVASTATLQAALGPQAVLPGTVTTPVQRLAPGVVVVEKPRGVGLAQHPQTPALQALLQRGGVTVRVYANPAALKWTKLLTNLLGSATAALLDWPPARIYAHGGLFALEMAQLREALAVMRALDLPVVALPGVPSRALAWGVTHLPRALLQPILRYKVGRGRGEKMPSLHQDLHRGDGQTEIDALQGAVAATARRLGFSAPTNALLARLVREVAAGQIPAERFRHRPQALLAAWQEAHG